MHGARALLDQAGAFGGVVGALVLESEPEAEHAAGEIEEPDVRDEAEPDLCGGELVTGCEGKVDLDRGAHEPPHRGGGERPPQRGVCRQCEDAEPERQRQAAVARRTDSERGCDVDGQNRGEDPDWVATVPPQKPGGCRVDGDKDHLCRHRRDAGDTGLQHRVHHPQVQNPRDEADPADSQHDDDLVPRRERGRGVVSMRSMMVAGAERTPLSSDRYCYLTGRCLSSDRRGDRLGDVTL